MKKNFQIAGIIFIIAFLWILSGIFKSGEEPTAELTSKEEQLPQVRIKELTAQLREKPLILRGRTEAHKLVTLRPRITAIVEEIIADKGSSVKAGDTILRLSEDTRRKELKKAEADVVQKRIEYTAAQQLYKKGYSSQTQQALAEAELNKSLSSLEEAKLNLSYTELKAPFDGIIDNRHVNVGDQISPTTAVMEIIAIDPILVKTDVSERDVHKLQKNQIAHIQVLDLPERQGKIRFISSIANTHTRAFPVEIEVNNSDQTFKSGVTAEVLIVIDKQTSHKISPALLSLSGDGTVGVKILTDDNRVEFIPVTILDQESDGIWLEGLPNNIRLITVGQSFVTHGEKVQPITESKEAA